MNLADPRTALNNLVTAITAITLPAAYGSDMVAFDKVKIFDLQDLGVAMEELFLYADRIALIGVDSIRHESSISGRTLEVNLSMSVTVVFSDRRFSDRQKALMGDSDTTPGTLQLQKILRDAISGELAGGAIAKPGDGRLLVIENEKRANETGRIAFAQDFNLSLGWDSASLSRAAKISAA